MKPKRIKKTKSKICKIVNVKAHTRKNKSIKVKPHVRKCPKKRGKKHVKKYGKKPTRNVSNKPVRKYPNKLTRKIEKKVTRKLTKKPVKKVTSEPKKKLTFAGDTKEEREFNRMKWEQGEQLKRYENICRNPPKKGISNKRFKYEIERGYKDKVINQLRFGRKLSASEFDITEAHNNKVIEAGTDYEYEDRVKANRIENKRRSEIARKKEGLSKEEWYG